MIYTRVELLFVLQEGWTPLHYAASHGYLDVLQVLLMAADCDITISNKVILHVDCVCCM